MIKKILIVFLFVLISITQNIYGEDTMQPLYNFNTALMPKLEPTIYSTKKVLIEGIFDFPADNAIATNREPGRNAVTLITFNEKKLKVKYKTIAKNFKSYVWGGREIHLPIFSEDYIGYTQSRGFTLLNLKTKRCIIGGIANMDYAVPYVGVIDPEKNIFIFGVFGGKSNVDFLSIMEYGNGRSNILRQKKISKGNRIVGNTQNVIFMANKNTAQAMDVNFNEIDHPFVKKFNEEKEKFKGIRFIQKHPDLPFVTFSAKGGGAMYIISWRDKNKPVIQKMLDHLTSNYQFSYDGKWLEFDDMDNYMIMPVDPELPHFLGTPILLGAFPKWPSNFGSLVTAMTRNPSGFVIPVHEQDPENWEKEVGFLKKWVFSEAYKLINKQKGYR